MDITPAQLILRCYAENSDGQWQAFCLDLDLAAQGESLGEVRDTLHAMIVEYVFDAVAGEDQEHAAYLLTRRAPFSVWARYYLYCALARVGRVRQGLTHFIERLPLSPPGAPLGQV